jgi:hypothetical protein
VDIAPEPAIQRSGWMNDDMDSASCTDEWRIFAGTWNMHGKVMCLFLIAHLPLKNPPSSLSPFLDRCGDLKAGDGSQFHLVVIGTQECQRSIEKSVVMPSKSVWERYLKDYLAPDYLMVSSETMAALHIAVFVLRTRRHLIKSINTLLILSQNYRSAKWLRGDGNRKFCAQQGLHSYWVRA